jgi:hypothetical protein
MPVMRWDDLFTDLDAQFDAELARDAEVEIGERTRFERGQVKLAERLGAATGSVLTLGVAGQPDVRGTLLLAGSDWLLLQEERGVETVVSARAVSWIEGLGRGPAAPVAAPERSARVDLRMVLGRIARDRSALAVQLRGGGGLGGTIAAVAADHLDVVVHDAGDDVRAARGVRAIPLVALALVRRW